VCKHYCVIVHRRWQLERVFHTWCTHASGVGQTCTKTSSNTATFVSLHLTWNATASVSIRTTTNALYLPELVCRVGVCLCVSCTLFLVAQAARGQWHSAGLSRPRAPGFRYSIRYCQMVFACKITSCCIQRLWYATPWLTDMPTSDKQSTLHVSFAEPQQA